MALSKEPRKMCKNISVWIFGLLKLGCTIAIICILSIHLQDFTWDYTWDDTSISFNQTNAHCLVWTEIKNYEACNYMYVVCGVSLVVSAIVSLLLCCTCNLCGVGGLIEWALSLFGVVWWIIAACYFSDEGSNANDANIPQEGWRNANIGLSWGNAFLFTLTLFITTADIIQDCIACCTKRKAEKAGKGDHKKEETAPKEEPKPTEPPKKQDIAAPANAV